MKTVKQISQLTGVSVRTLHHYHTIGLLPPTEVSPAGYRLYDDDALQRLRSILVLREFRLSLHEIGVFLDAPPQERRNMLASREQALKEQIQKLEKRAALAASLQRIGVEHMDLHNTDPRNLDDYTEQAKLLYGKTEAYGEYTKKSAGRSKQQEQALGDQVMDFFVRLAKMRPLAADSPQALEWAAALQTFFTRHYYTCTPQILACLAESYGDGGPMNQNIDRAAGEGTGAFAKEVVNAYLSNM